MRKKKRETSSKKVKVFIEGDENNSILRIIENNMNGKLIVENKENGAEFKIIVPKGKQKILT